MVQIAQLRRDDSALRIDFIAIFVMAHLCFFVGLNDHFVLREPSFVLSF